VERRKGPDDAGWDWPVRVDEPTAVEPKAPFTPFVGKCRAGGCGHDAAIHQGGGAGPCMKMGCECLKFVSPEERERLGPPPREIVA
jgi:hypothetical protein